MIEKPSYNIESDYFANYVQKAKGTDLLPALEVNLKETIRLYESLVGGKESFQYAEGKWTVKQVLQHIIDTERIFTYRALRIARADKTPLPGYEENDYAAHDNTKNRSLTDLIQEFKQVRMSSITLFASFALGNLDREGLASNVTFTPRIIGWLLCGHAAHHNNVIQERYIG